MTPWWHPRDPSVGIELGEELRKAHTSELNEVEMRGTSLQARRLGGVLTFRNA
ncbi:hypothetical protein GCM10010472_65870 [Pseudonocardia halophobica]|uniref:Uncharacterized protein n=1 Tax=Pseudonocardia halophobica TaxID=29401 RepID=A0A9W6NYQ2_9PSEU|nr:hypothetical protein [Pseudonocardia halophobica]GLL14038.1 hypothetical protein GCM10017577_51830 [Pseudonocardia halophobica]